MNTKLKVGIGVLLLFAALFLFVIAEAPAQLLRWGRPIVVVALLGLVIYGAVSVLRNVPTLDRHDPAPDKGCKDEGCGCHSNQPTRPQSPTAPAQKGKR